MAEPTYARAVRPKSVMEGVLSGARKSGDRALVTALNQRLDACAELRVFAAGGGDLPRRRGCAEGSSRGPCNGGHV